MHRHRILMFRTRNEKCAVPTIMVINSDDKRGTHGGEAEIH